MEWYLFTICLKQTSFKIYEYFLSFQYKVSYDDVIYKATIICSVVVKELLDDPNLSYITPKGLRNTKALLKETLENEGEMYSENEDIGGADDEETDGNIVFFSK